jgi:pyruvate/2-oxoglutarate dehydrogenase complex dihydrolipoamide dehydrogenase (E3) component
MKRAPEYDMAVIGGGGAGLAAAFIASNLTARTILVERERLGGECTFNRLHSQQDADSRCA